MGTSYAIKYVGDEVQGLSAEIEQELVRLNKIFSTYDPASEISTLNNSSVGEQMEVSDELAAVLMTSRKIHELSGGAFDITIGPLVNTWGFGPDGPRHGVPAEEKILAAKSNVGFEFLQLDGRVVTRSRDIYIDLSAIAKGYAVDVIAQLLDERGITNYLVEIGGEVKARGMNDRQTYWVLAVEAPDVTQRRIFRTLPINGLAMATSGDYRNYFEVEGKRYSHTIDPRSGWPVSHNLASITVLHESSEFADGLATAFSVLGLDDTMRIAEERNLLVLAIIREQEELSEITSSSLQAYLEKTTL